MYSGGVEAVPSPAQQAQAAQRLLPVCRAIGVSALRASGAREVVRWRDAAVLLYADGQLLGCEPEALRAFGAPLPGRLFGLLDLQFDVCAVELLTA